MYQVSRPMWRVAAHESSSAERGARDGQLTERQGKETRTRDINVMDKK